MSTVEQRYGFDRAQLVRAIRPRCRSRDEAEDVLHEALAHLIEIGRECVPALLYRSAVNILLDRRKHESTCARLHRLVVAGTENTQPSPYQELRAQQFAALFDRAMGQLVIEHEAWANAFLLRTQHDLEWADIGKRLGVGTRMAQIYVTRAVEYCHEYIEA